MRSFRRFVKDRPITPDRGVVLTWGRYNPPTIGHETVFNEAARTANDNGYSLRIMATHSHDAKKNPLVYEDKIEYIKSLFPRYRDYVHESAHNDLIKVVEELNSSYQNIILIAGADRLAEYTTLLNKYNGTLYTYDTISVISSGDRDPESDGVSGVSASGMRQHCAEGNFQKFTTGLPRSTAPDLARSLFESVRSGMGVKGKLSIDLDRTDAREKFYSGELVSEGDIVRKLGESSTLGVIMSVGPNYVIVESHGTRSRHWAKDIERIDASHEHGRT